MNTWQNYQNCFYVVPLQWVPPATHYAMMTNTQTHKVKTLTADAVAAGRYNYRGAHHAFKQVLLFISYILLLLFFNLSPFSYIGFEVWQPIKMIIDNL